MLGKSRSRKFALFFTTLVAALLVIGVLAATASFAQDTAQPSTTTASSSDGLLAEVYNRLSPSVVAISVEQQTNLTLNGQSQPQEGLGSGFVIDTEGHILTNNHVVDGATNIEVAFSDGTLAHATVVGQDPDSDLAVIQVEVPSEALHPVTFADSDSLYVGQTVLAIGSPFGERWTLTSGIVSGLDRLIQGMTNFSIGGVIQTDAAINPGNSGGPLLNLEGHVVGVNAQIATESGSNSGVGFAIPGNLAQRVAKDLIEKGQVEYSYLGISGGDVTLDAIEALSLPNDTRGVLVGQVTNGSPADDAGLQTALTSGRQGTGSLTSADIITSIDGQPLYGIADLISYLAGDTTPGETVTLSVLRDGTEQLNLDVTLAPRS